MSYLTTTTAATPPSSFISTVLNASPTTGFIRVDTPDNYEAITVIAEGIQGTVIEAWDSVNAKRLAIKKCRDLFTDPSRAKQCYREFALAATVNHENIIRLQDAYTPQQSINEFTDIYYVFDCMDCNLYQFSHNRRDLFTHRHGGDFIGLLMRQLLCAVKFLHQPKLRLIHRDIKPTNILVKHTKEHKFDYLLKLADLGSARQIPPTNDEIMSQYVVARAYRAPEVILTDNYERQVDLWSVGCVIAELIIGKPLFVEIDSFKLVYSIMEAVDLTNEDVKKLPQFVRDNVMQDPGRFVNSCLEVILRHSAPAWESSKIGITAYVFLVKRLLAFNPANRITAEEALNLPMWSTLSNKHCYYDREATNEYSEVYNNQNYGTTWKEILFNMINEYHQWIVRLDNAKNETPPSSDSSQKSPFG